ncbi:MAG: hypothetical protein IJ115_07130 [Erysipelotrichaceae bacterium]|nr:hypothetical protein [Erysipelotrichaceae bacterium]
MTKYMKEKDSNRIIRYQGEGSLLEYYDYDKKKWIEDIELGRVFFGSIEVNTITEEEANAIIKNNSK